MKVCLICEGNYPHISGGVSSWVRDLIKKSPHIDYIIYAIGAEKVMKGKFAYDFPDNIIEVKEIFLDELNSKEDKSSRKLKLSKEDKEILHSLISGSDVRWDGLFEFFRNTKIKDVSSFFLSRDFFDILKAIYFEKFEYTPFNEYIWGIRSMYLPLFLILNSEIPKADIYHCTAAGYAGIIGAYGKYCYKSGLILSEHGIYTREREEEIIQSTWVKPYHKDLWIDFFYNFSYCIYKYADVVTSLFPLSRDLQIDVGCDPNKIILIPNGIDSHAYSEITESRFSENGNEDVKGEYKGRLVIGAIVRIVPIKDIKTMIQMFLQVKKTFPNAVIYIMGPTTENEEYYQECVKLVEILEVEDVIFTGRINIFDYLAKIDICVLTSLSEGQPYAVMEALAAGIPVVSTNVGDCTGMIKGYDDGHGDAGYLSTVMDIVGLANQVIKLAKDKNLRLEMGKNGANRVKNIYKLNKWIEEYHRLYEKLGGNKNGGNRI